MLGHLDLSKLITYCVIMIMIREKGNHMKNHNKLPLNQNNIETEWDTLREIPFNEERKDSLHVRDLITKKLTEISKSYSGEKLSIKTFMLFLLGDLQPILSENDLFNVIEDYKFWEDALGEIKPILAGYWAECDPMIISYLFLIFVSQFMVLLNLWQKIDFVQYCVQDCVMLGEFYLDLSTVQGDMLMNVIKRWGLQDSQRPALEV